jgi:hypothetical protein
MKGMNPLAMAGGMLTAGNLPGLQGDSTQAFTDCILLYAKNLEADAVSVELQVCPPKFLPIVI